jgi:uncharacterized lipoprotein YddW (UPF0748 family)
MIIINPVRGYESLVTLERNGSNVYHYMSSEKVLIPDTYTEKDTEFRGVWVATVYNLNMPTHTSETQYKAAFQNLISELLESNMNAMLFQVRPTNDAFYESDYAPWSKYLTGSEGVDPGWDVLAWMIEECHANGIEFHAWMNPYRVYNAAVTQDVYIPTLSADNFAKQRPDLVITGNLDSHNRYPIILNPGEPEVKTYIRNVVTEIITKYDVDGVHFDDYFYPYSGLNSDLATYEAYKLPDQSIEDWRRENVNDVVRGIKEDIDAYNETSGESVKFGISPSGLWGSGIEGYPKTLEGGSNTAITNLSTYHTQFADSKKWVEQGWLHYICPQVYFSFTHSTAPYADVVDWWASISRGTGVDVYIGHAPSSAYSQNWLTEEISDQLRYNQKHPEIKGEVMYSASYLDYTHMQYVEANNWTVTPSNIYESTGANIDISLSGDKFGNIYINDVTITLTSTDTVWYQLDDGEWTEYLNPVYVTGTGAHVLYMKTEDSLGVFSSVTSYNIAIQYLNGDVPTINVTGNQIDGNYVVGSVITLTSDSADIYVAINHGSVGEFVLYTEPIVLDDTGGYYIKAKTIDERGTESEEAVLSVTVQEECYDAPSISVTGSGQDPFYQSAVITLTGETDMQYMINDGNWISYTGPFTLDQEGSYTIYYRNDDACMVALSKDITIDNTAPNVADIQIDGTYDGEKYYTSETVVSLSSDEVNNTIYYRLHNGSTWSSWKVYTEEIDLLYTANFTFEYYVVDQAQNQSEVVSTRVRLQVPPSETNLYVIRNGEVVTYYNSDVPIELPTSYTEKTEQIRAVWVATVSNIDVGLHTSEEQYKSMIISMLDEIEENNFNVIFFQVRPMNDAFYDSDYAPWSRYLTGVEGQDPGWDVLDFVIKESHKRGIEFHAWLNPYRVSTGTESMEDQLALLHEDNFAKQNPDLVIADNKGKLILNPGERQVQVYIRNVIQELISKYDVDGIHFDDYFYSYNGTPLTADSELYNRQKDPGETLEDWRRENINTVIREVHEVIVEYNLNHETTIEFGISPFGIWKSGGDDGSNTSPYAMQSYSDQYADTKHWVEQGWLDYIMPQLYWQFDHSAAPFADLVDWWAALCEENNVDLIIGQGFYRYDDDTWTDTNELLEQLRYISKYEVIIGSSFFSYRTLNSLDKEVVESLERLNNYYWTEYATFPWESTVVKEPDPVCGIGEEYVDGKCQSVCSVGEEYVDGNCQSICSVGEEYVDGNCQSVCEVGEEYVDGDCQSVCEVGEEYVDGDCQSICSVGEEYVDGSCQSICGVDQTYQDGNCVYDPCPSGYERIDGVCELIEEPKTGCFLFNVTPMLLMALISFAGFFLSRKWKN